MITLEQSNSAELRIREVASRFIYDTKEYTIEVILKKLSAGEIVDSNNYNSRQDDDNYDFCCSELIERILLSLPLPIVVASTYANLSEENPDCHNLMEIITEKQVLEFIKVFTDSEFPLTGLRLLPELNGFRFKDFTPGRQRRFLRVNIRFRTFTGVDEEVKRYLING
jgi:hypothetical protein